MTSKKTISNDVIQSINEYIDVAFKIFKSSSYSKDIKIIKRLFEEPKAESNYIDTVSLRLTVIDSLYSTNMSKRLYGLEDLTHKLASDNSNDNYWIKAFINFIDENNDSQIKNVFEADYGIRKNGQKAGHAYSLISKYAYYITNYEFPIYDSLVKNGHNFLSKKYKEIEPLPTNFDFKYSQICEYFQILKRLSQNLSTNDNERPIKFERLDCFLWTIGKIKSGNFQNLMSKGIYEKFIENIKSSMNSDIRPLSEKIILDCVKKNPNILSKSTGSEDFKKFFEYVI